MVYFCGTLCRVASSENARIDCSELTNRERTFIFFSVRVLCLLCLICVLCCVCVRSVRMGYGIYSCVQDEYMGSFFQVYHVLGNGRSDYAGYLFWRILLGHHGGYQDHQIVEGTRSTERVLCIFGVVGA